MENLGLLPSCISPVPSYRKSGYQKRKEKNALPQAFLLYCSRDHHVHGAAVFHDVCRSPSEDTVIWYASRGVQLVEAVVVTEAMLQYSGAIFRLAGEAESMVRLRMSTVGGALSTQFPEFEFRQLRCIRVTQADLDKLFADPGAIVQVITPSSYARLAGVVPKLECPFIDAFIHNQEELAIDDDLDHGLLPATGRLEDRSSTRSTDVVADRLQSLYKTTERGCVRHRYNVEALLDYLFLNSYLKPSSDIGNVLAASASIFFGGEGESLALALRTHKFQLPTYSCLRDARLRLDYCYMVYQQRAFLRFQSLHYQLVDASPQLGFQFLAVVEDVIRIPEPCCLNLMLRVGLDLNDCWESNLLALSSLGYGRAGGVKKALSVSNLLLMSVPSAESFHDKRCRYRGQGNDLGVEKDITDMTIDIIPRFRGTYHKDDPMRYLFPWMMGFATLLHILWGGFEQTCKSSHMFQTFVATLSPILAFISDKQLMRKMRAVCCEDDVAARQALKNQASVAIDWRWESMGKALDMVLPIYRTFKIKFDKNALLSSDSGNLLDCNKIKQCADALDAPNFEPVGELYRVLGRIVHKFAGELEICDCHKDLWVQGRSFKRRQALMSHEVGGPTCVWQGRRLPWFIAVGFTAFVQELRTSTSPRLQAYLAVLPSDARADLTKEMEAARSFLISYYADKCSYLFHTPHLAVGAYHCEQGGSTARSQMILQEVLGEVDRVIAVGKIETLHRITRKHFVPGARVRREAEEFIASSTPCLRNYPHLFVMLQEYGLSPGVERRVEKIHALIKRQGAHSYGIGLPYLCALIHEPSNLQLLKKVPEFRSFCVESWHSHLLDRILHLRFTAAELRAMDTKKKQGLVYQCSIELEYADIHDSKCGRKEFLALTAHSRVKPPALKDETRACLHFLKVLFEKDEYYSIGLDLLDLSLAADVVHDEPVNCLDDCLAALGASDVDFAFVESSMAVFRVINTNPERRVVQEIQHLQKTPTLITVSLCKVRRCRDLGVRQQLLLESEATSVQKLDLRALLFNISGAVCTIHKWAKKGTLAAPRLQQTFVHALQGNNPSESLLPDVVGEDVSSLSLALPLPSGPHMHVQQSVQEVENAVAYLAGNEAFTNVGSVDWDTTDLHWDSVLALRNIGVLDYSADDFGSMQLALQPACLEWYSIIGVHRPLPLTRCGRRGGDFLKYTKVELLRELHEVGWMPGEVCGSHSVDSDLVYNQGIKQPLSYFAALLSRQSIFEKGVLDIGHKRVDHYYRCLLRLSGVALQAVLVAETSDKSDRWFKDEMAAMGHDALEDDEGPFESILAVQSAASSSAAASSLPILPDIVPQMRWARKLCHIGDGSVALKVYMDNCTHQSGVQRGWSNCDAHHCIRYVFCSTAETHLDFSAEMYAWHQARHGIDTKSAHLSYKPSPEAVREVHARLIMSDF